MDRKFEPVMIPGTSTPLPPQRAETVAVDSHRVLRNTYWLLALSMLPTIAGALAGMQLNFIALFKAAPIMTPLLMFGVMIGSLFVVTRLRDSAWGVLALFGFTFIAGLMLTPILTVAAGFRNGGQLVALSGGLTAAVFFSLAGYASVTKRDFCVPGQVPVRRPRAAHRRIARQHLPADPGAVGDDLGGRGPDLFALPAARPHQHRARRRDELRDGDAQPVPLRVQHLHQPAQPAARCFRAARLT
jgi:hypothetical protein